METILFAIIIIFNALISNELATLATVPWGPLFPFKPFNCEACLTFWFNFMFGSAWVWFLSSSDAELATAAVINFLISIINFIYVNSKFKIND